MLARQAPADFNGRCERRVETDHAQTGKTDELAGVFALQRPEAKAMLGKRLDDEIVLKKPEGEELFYITAIEYKPYDQD